MKYFVTSFWIFVLCSTALMAQTNYALVFGNSSDYVSFPNAAVSSLTNTATFEVWMNPAANNQTSRIIEHITANSGDGFLIDLLNGKPRIIIGSTALTGTTSLTANTWYHLACTSDGSTLSIYVNGVLDVSALASATFPANSYSLRLGLDQSGGNHFLGQMDEVRIWNIARTQAQIQSAMYSTLVGTETGLTGYWPMNEGSGTTVSDKCSAGNNGALLNFSLTAASGWVASSKISLTAPTVGDGSSSNPYRITTASNLAWTGQANISFISVWIWDFL